MVSLCEWALTEFSLAVQGNTAKERRFTPNGNSRRTVIPLWALIHVLLSSSKEELRPNHTSSVQDLLHTPPILLLKDSFNLQKVKSR